MTSYPPTGGGWTTPPGAGSGQPPPYGAGTPPYGAGSPPHGTGTPADGSPPPPYGWTSPTAPAAPKPGVVPLRALGLGEILDGAFTTIRRYPLATLGLTAVVMLVAQVVRVVSSYLLLSGVNVDLRESLDTNSFDSSDVGDALARLAAVDGVALLVALVSGLVVTGVITVVIGQAVLGRPVSAGEAWSRTRPLLGRLLAVSLLVPLASLAVFAVGLVPGVVVLVAGARAVGVLLLVLGGLAGLVAAVWLVVSWELSAAAVVLERQPVLGALRRSRQLVHGSWWRVFGIALLATFMAGVIGNLVAAPFAVVGGLGSLVNGGDLSSSYHLVPLVLGGVGGLLGATISRPFVSGVIGLLYVDRRIRAEALDLTLSEAAGTGAPGQGTPGHATPGRGGPLA